MRDRCPSVRRKSSFLEGSVLSVTVSFGSPSSPFEDDGHSQPISRIVRMPPRLAVGNCFLKSNHPVTFTVAR